MSEIKISLPDKIILDGLVEREVEIRRLRQQLKNAHEDLSTFTVIAKEYFDDREPWSAFAERWKQYRKEYPLDR